MQEISMIDTAKAIFENYEDVFNSHSPNYKRHQWNLKMLNHLDVIPIVDEEYLIEKDRIYRFINSGGKTDREIETEKTLNYYYSSLKLSKIAIGISLLALAISIWK